MRRQRLEAVAEERLLVDDHLAALEDAAEERGRRAIQDDEVELVGAQVLRHHADQVDTGPGRIHASSR
jgi:hypothetical protein